MARDKLIYLGLTLQKGNPVKNGIPVTKDSSSFDVFGAFSFVNDKSETPFHKIQSVFSRKSLTKFLLRAQYNQRSGEATE